MDCALLFMSFVAPLNGRFSRTGTSSTSSNTTSSLSANLTQITNLSNAWQLDPANLTQQFGLHVYGSGASTGLIVESGSDQVTSRMPMLTLLAGVFLFVDHSCYACVHMFTTAAAAHTASKASMPHGIIKPVYTSSRLSVVYISCRVCHLRVATTRPCWIHTTSSPKYHLLASANSPKL